MDLEPLRGLTACSIGVIAVGLVSAIALAYSLPPENWDEARRGVNALEMICQGDYLNYSYLGEPDTFNTKPPLFLWLVAASFHLFGAGTFSLRLTSVLALIALVFYFHQWIKSHFGAYRAFLTTAAIVSVNGIIGFHVGISGDTDMLFVLFTTVALCEGYDFLESGRRAPPLRSVVALTLAFLTKGVAVGLILPGLALAALLHPKAKERWRSPALRQALGLLVVLLAATFWLLSVMGTSTFGPDGYGSLLEAMIGRDGWQRFADESFEAEQNPFYLFMALDIRFGPLIYVLYLGALIGAIHAIKRPQKWDTASFTFFSLCVVGGLFLLLQLSANRHNWYVAPAIPFLAYLFAVTVDKLTDRRTWVVGGMLVLVGVATFQRWHKMLTPATPTDLPTEIRAQTPQAEVFRYMVEEGSCPGGGE